MHVTAWYRETHGQKFTKLGKQNKCQLARPLMVSNFATLQKEV